MAEGLQMPDGTPLNIPGIEDIEQNFARAMSTPTTEPPAVAPPPKAEPAAEPRRRGRPPKDKAEKPRVSPAKPSASAAPKDYTKDLHGVLQLAWGGLAAFAPADAAAVKVHGPGMVTAFNALAQENAQVARGIEWLTTGSAYGAVVMATVPLLLQIAVNHGQIPFERVAPLGVNDPRALAEMTANDVAQAQAYMEQQMQQEAAA